MSAKRRKRRSKEEIDEIIDEATNVLIEECGFKNVTVRNIADEANIEPIVFYHRYQNVEDYIDNFVKKYDYWLADIFKADGPSTDKELYLHILKNLFKSLKENKQMQELLRWEIADINETTQRTARLREFHTIPLVEKYKKIFKNAPFEIEVISALLIGGIYYLILHAELTPFSGIDVNSEEGNEKICRALDYWGNNLFDNISSFDSKIMEVAKKMKERGIEITVIEECTNVPKNVLNKL